MFVSIGRPSSMDAKLAEGVAEPTTLIQVQPRRYSKTQRKVSLFPFNIIVDGEITDQGYINVDVKSGRLRIEHRVEEIPIDELEEGNVK